MNWNPFGMLRKKNEPRLEKKLQNSFCVEQINGVKVEVLEYEDMLPSEFKKFIKQEFPKVQFGSIDAESYGIYPLIGEKQDGKITDSNYSETKGLITTSMGPCSFVASFLPRGVFLFHLLTLKSGLAPSEQLRISVEKSLPEDASNVTLLLGVGKSDGGDRKSVV